MDVDQEILALVSRLGHLEPLESGESVFVPEARPAKTLREIRRILNKDIEDGDDFSAVTLADVQALKLHFIPLLLACAGQAQMNDTIDELTKLFVLLTLPDTPMRNHFSNELVVSFVDHARAPVTPLMILTSRLEKALATDASKRSDQDRKAIELFLYFVRNLLALSNGPLSRNDLIREFSREAVIDILLHFTKHVERKNNREWSLLLLESFFHMFRGTTPYEILAAGKSLQEKTIENKKSHQGVNKASPIDVQSKMSLSQGLSKQALTALREQKRMANRHLSSRHARFGGTLHVVGEGQEGVVSVVNATSFGSKIANHIEVSNNLIARKRRVQDASVIPDTTNASSKPGQIMNQEVYAVLVRVADELLDGSYGPLCSVIIQDIRREDTRIKREDEVRFIWFIGYFTQLARLKRGWFKSSVATTMDLWTFQFVVTQMNRNLDDKAWANLESSSAALQEMITCLKSAESDEEIKSLRNAVFYEMRERFDIISRLMKLWDPVIMSHSTLRVLASIGDTILDIQEDMANEGALAKAKVKARIRIERRLKSAGVFNLHWEPEENFALLRGVRDRGSSDLAIMREILKDPALGPIFAEHKRTPQQLAARWILIKEALSSGKTIDQFVKEELEKEQSADKEDEEKAEDEVRQSIGGGTIEKTVDFFSALRPFLSNQVYRNLSRLIDPVLHPEGEAGVLRDSVSLSLVLRYFRRLRAFKKGLKGEETLEPALWHVETLTIWYRYLEAAMRVPSEQLSQDARELNKVMLSSLRRLFRISAKAPAVLVDLLFWRTKLENVVMSRGYRERGAEPQGSREVLEYEEQHEEELAEIDEGAESGDEEEEGEFAEVKSTEERPKTTSTSLTGQKSTHEKKKATDKKQSSKAKRDTKEKSANKRTQPKGPVQVAVDTKQLKAAVALALQAGATAEAFLSLIDAFESASECHIDLPFIISESTALERAFKLKDMAKVMLSLHMRPPNRSLESKSKSLFSVETYWRLPTSRMSLAELRRCAEELRGAMLDDAPLEQSIDIPDSNWCFSDEDIAQDSDKESVASASERDGSEGGNELSAGDDEESEDSSSDDDDDSDDANSDFPQKSIRSVASSKSSVVSDAESTSKPAISKPVREIRQQRRIVVSSDDEDDDKDDDNALREDEINRPAKSVVSAVDPEVPKSKETAAKRRRVVSDDEDD